MANDEDKKITLIFFSIPTILLIIGYFLYPFPPSHTHELLIQIPIFLGIVLLGIGFFWKEKNTGKKIKIAGWSVFAFFWSLMPNYLYSSEYGDVFNASACIIGVYVLFYLAYHEWLSLKRNEEVTCLNWTAGAAFIAGIIYFTIDSQAFPLLKEALVEWVARETSAFLNLFGLETVRQGPYVFYQNYPIRIIFSCTAIQAMAFFAGMIIPLAKADAKRKTIAILVTIVPMWFLNIVRTSSVVYLVAGNITSFEIAHNLLSKLGALITLIVLLYITFKILPGLLDELYCFLDLPKRKGPVENFVKDNIWKRK